MPQPKEKPVRHIGLVKAEKPDLSKLIREDGGYFRAYNDLTDVLIREMGLNVYEQAVLYRLVRLSHGWERVTCTVGFASLMSHTNISRNHLRRTLTSLTKRGLIENQGTTRAGTTYRVLPGVGLPPKGTQQVPIHQVPISRGVGGAQRGAIKAGKGTQRGAITDKETDSLTNTAVCSLCSNTGLYYPEGFTKGVARCPCKGGKV